MGREIKEGMRTSLQVLVIHQRTLVTFGTIKLPQKIVLLLRLPLEVREKLGFQTLGEQVCWAEDTAATRPVKPEHLLRAS